MKSDSEMSKEQIFMERAKFVFIFLAAGWAAYTFVYKEWWVPAHQPVALSVSSTLEEVGRKEGMAAVRLRIKVTNQSRSTVWVPALWYTVEGVRMRRADLSDSAYASLLDSANSQPEYARPARHFVLQSTPVIATGRFVSGRKDDWLWYQPDQETINEDVIWVPTDRYDAVFCIATAILAKDLDRLAYVGWAGEEGLVEARFFLKGPGFADDSSRTVLFDDANVEHRDWVKESGIGETWSVSTLSLWHTAQ